MIYSVDYELKQIALLDASSNANLDPNKWWLLILAFREITYTLICYTFTSIIKKATFKQQIIYGLDTRPGEVLMKKRGKTSAKRIAKMKFEKDLGPKAQLDSAEIFRSTKTAFLKGYLY